MRWITHVVAQLLIVVASLILAPFAVLFFSTPDKRHLTRLRWLETIDFDLAGDPGWQNVRIWGKDPLSYSNRVRWLWRNGGNTVSYYVLGCTGDTGWNAQQDRSLRFWKRPDGYWLYRRFVPLAKTRKLELFFGWNLFSVKQGRCKIVCQVRFPKA